MTKSALEDLEIEGFYEENEAHLIQMINDGWIKQIAINLKDSLLNVCNFQLVQNGFVLPQLAQNTLFGQT